MAWRTISVMNEDMGRRNLPSSKASIYLSGFPLPCLYFGLAKKAAVLRLHMNYHQRDKALVRDLAIVLKKVSKI